MEKEAFFNNSPIKTYLVAVTSAALCFAISVLIVAIVRWSLNGVPFGFLQLCITFLSGFIAGWFSFFIIAIIPFIIGWMIVIRFKIYNPMFFILFGIVISILISPFFLSFLKTYSAAHTEVAPFSIICALFALAGAIFGIAAWKSAIKPQ